jgi:hypothetical protein
MYVYDVAIAPTTGATARRVKRRIWQLAEISPEWQQKGLAGLVAHDHASKLVAARPLELPLVLNIPFHDEDEAGPGQNARVFTLTFSFVTELSMTDVVRYTHFFLAIETHVADNIFEATSMEIRNIASTIFSLYFPLLTLFLEGMLAAPVDLE